MSLFSCILIRNEGGNRSDREYRPRGRGALPAPASAAAAGGGGCSVQVPEQYCCKNTSNHSWINQAPDCRGYLLADCLLFQTLRSDPEHAGSTIHTSKSLNGPWLPLTPNTLPGCTNPAPHIHRNGTIFIVCNHNSLLRAESLQ